MKLTKLSLLLTPLIGLPALAQPTFITEIEAGDKWLLIEHVNGSYEETLKANGAKSETDIDADGTGISGVFALSRSGSFTPLIGVSFTEIEAEDEDTTISSFTAGALLNSNKNQKTVMSLSYNKSQDDENIRDSLDASAAFQLSNNSSTIFNELSVSLTYKKDNDIVDGGHEIEISNLAKFPINSQVELVGLVGIEFSTEYEDAAGDTLNYDPELSFGAELNIHPTPMLTLQLSVLKSFANGEYSINGQNVDRELDGTLTSVGLLARF